MAARRVLVVGAALVAAAGLWAALTLVDPFGHRAIRSKLRVGMSAAEVVDALGELPWRDYRRGTALDDYYVDGWARRERAITHRVLIFRVGEPICYVWLDANDRVEEFFVGGS